jgi:dephospho-CoA kinase
MTKIIGLTGGIGSGKSTVARMFMTNGIPVYIADEEAKKIMESETIINEVATVFGKDILFDSSIDRVKLAKIVFNNPEKLAQLNKIVHPVVQEHFKNWVKNYPNVPFVIKETAILFETGGHLQCDKVITVVAPELLRVQRVILRDKLDKKSVIQRMNNQWSDEQKILLSDFIIENIDLEKTKFQVYTILKELSKR